MAHCFLFSQNCVNEHCIIESKPENTVNDLRFGDPWPCLEDYVSKIDLEAMDALEHSHVPYGALCGRIAH